VEACVGALEGGEIQVEELPLPLCPEFSEEHAGTEDDGVLSWHLGVHYPQQDHYEMWLSIPEGSDRPAEIYVHLRNEDDPLGVLAGILMWLEEFIAKLSHEVAAAHAEFIRAPHHLDLKAAAAWFKRLMRDAEKLEFSFDLVGFRRTLLSLGQEVDHPEAEDISKGYAKRFKKGLSPAIRKTIQRASTQIEHIVHATSKVPSEEAAQAALRFMSANPGLCSLLTPDMVKKALRNPREANHRTQALREELAVDVVKQIHGRSIPKDTALKVLKNK
jgi:hypothetical protein